jgi:glycerol-3-phosphate acyltransferase PlsY
MRYFIAFCVGFFAGAIPFGYLIAKIRGVNIRKEGSGNIGFSNVFRIVGKGEGLLVLALDVAKGLIPVLCMGKYLGFTFGLIAGISAMLGHMFTPFLKFRGGKGVATGLGVFIGLAPFSALFTFVVWLIVVISTRYISLGSIVAACVLPLFIYFSRYMVRDEYNLYLVVFTIFVCLLVIILHRSNIKRLIHRKERKFSFRRERDE